VHAEGGCGCAAGGRGWVAVCAAQAAGACRGKGPAAGAGGGGRGQPDAAAATLLKADATATASAHSGWTPAGGAAAAAAAAAAAPATPPAESWVGGSRVTLYLGDPSCTSRAASITGKGTPGGRGPAACMSEGRELRLIGALAHAGVGSQLCGCPRRL